MHNQKTRNKKEKYCLVLSQHSFIVAHHHVYREEKKIQVNTKKETKNCIGHVYV
jgi:hypothetical protein